MMDEEEKEANGDEENEEFASLDWADQFDLFAC
ncbi:hypothetical protein B23_3632 [Geobacillus thermoleovorans B23]|jgi:hypothetical protein|nr:hypothetical protein B23_3632 [Geobacillus thermoleovorans B23]